MSERILIVEDEAALCESLRRVFERDGYDVSTAGNAEAGLLLYEAGGHDLILCDILLPGMDGIEFLEAVRKRCPEQIVIVMTAYASIETAVGALRAGAHDYILKPVIHEEIKRLVRMALHQRSLQSENALLRKQLEERHDFQNILGASTAIQGLIEQVKRVADSRSNILVLGETGTGKELFTRAIHHNSPRRSKPFIPINCSAIPDHLLESELFGYVKGAFTGATQTKRGLFEEADEGTVFLDEIADLSPHLQAKLLRVIDDHEIRPLGSTQSRKVDLRFIAATNRDVIQAVREGTLREDLFYRLNVVTLHLPPLRERKEDIPILAAQFIAKFAQELGKRVRDLDPAAARLLREYPWPGNVRELQNIIERAVLITDGTLIRPGHLPEGLKTGGTFAGQSLEEGLSIEGYTKAFIRRYQATLTEQQLADRLGITRKALWEKRKRWNLTR
ncbi:sigma-54-dependent transcriptional regulator [Desulfatiglans anilini]|uniref:sigma-54-dependent transcriptional regulator n=1 Tax=Desulfatiglans anilini TaxID=90728 RepID=UPI0004180E39|nr:sigma-54 dependent transcriptional regulator [Desulfatiglans anilini]